MSETTLRVLFVCTGNICRSPTAHAVFLQRVREAGLAGRIEVDSAGTHGFHAGQAPDHRSTVAAAHRGYDLRDQRARQIEAADLSTFDYVLAMDGDNLAMLQALMSTGGVSTPRARVGLLLDYVEDVAGQDVPDPYYGARNGFEEVLDLVERGAEQLLAHVRQQHGL